jgi:hypothetical protein
MIRHKLCAQGCMSVVCVPTRGLHDACICTALLFVHTSLIQLIEGVRAGCMWLQACVQKAGVQMPLMVGWRACQLLDDTCACTTALLVCVARSW